MAREDSTWGRLILGSGLEGSGAWRPPQAPVSLEDDERRMLAAFGIRKKAPDG